MHEKYSITKTILKKITIAYIRIDDIQSYFKMMKNRSRNTLQKLPLQEPKSFRDSIHKHKYQNRREIQD